MDISCYGVKFISYENLKRKKYSDKLWNDMMIKIKIPVYYKDWNNNNFCT